MGRAVAVQLTIPLEAQEFLQKLETCAPDLSLRLPFARRPLWTCDRSGHEFSVYRRGARYSMVSGQVDNVPGGALLTLKDSFAWPDAIVHALLFTVVWGVLCVFGGLLWVAHSGGSPAQQRAGMELYFQYRLLPLWVVPTLAVFAGLGVQARQAKALASEFFQQLRSSKCLGDGELDVDHSVLEAGQGEAWGARGRVSLDSFRQNLEHEAEVARGSGMQWKVEFPTPTTYKLHGRSEQERRGGTLTLTFNGELAERDGYAVVTLERGGKGRQQRTLRGLIPVIPLIVAMLWMVHEPVLWSEPLMLIPALALVVLGGVFGKLSQLSEEQNLVMVQDLLRRGLRES